MKSLARVVAEAGVVAGVAVGIAFLANAVSPRGLSLRRDYFPRAAATSSSAIPAVAPVDPSTNSLSSSNTAATLERLRRKGFQILTTAEMEQVVRDPRVAEERVVLVDARDEARYREGHLAAARLFDRFYPERYLPGLLPALLSAEQVVVYCQGGECEDSEFAADMLHEAGVAAERVMIYTGGVEEWLARGLPVESGDGPNPGKGP